MVTVTYQDATGLKRTLQSVERQTHTGIQHIVIDGGSTDGTHDLLSAYRPRYAVHVVSERDRGIFDAINKGLRLASGHLIVCMNSGDTFNSETDLEFVCQDWATEHWSWAFGCQRFVDAQGVALGGVVPAPYNRRKLELGLSFVPHQAMYVEREFQLGLGEYDETLGVAADQEMAIRAAQRAEPRVWVRFLTDFLVGGAHANVSRLHREWLYHRIRTLHGRPVLASRGADVIVTAGIATGRTMRDVAAGLLNPGARRRL